MIKVIRNSDMFSQPEAIPVIPTNLEGVMGRGLAKYIKKINRPGFFEYRRYCKQGVHTLDTPVLVGKEQKFICVATKVKWRDDSDLNTIMRATKGLVEWLNDHPDILAVSVPMLGAGAGNRYKNMERVDIALTILEELKNVKHCCVYFYV